MMKNSVSFGVLVVLTAFNSASAEVICRQSVGYHWQREKEDKPTEAHWISIEAKGADEAAAKKGLEEPLEREKKRAEDSCQKEHENLAGCVSAKYSSLASTLERLSFTQRKGVEEAIQSDCKARQGHCRDVVVGEVKCYELVIEGKASASPAAEEAGKKDPKKKK